MNAQQLKNSILQMAVQGKLVPQDPNDEPACVLLERIRKEKEKLIKEGKIKKEKNPSYIFRGEDNLPYEKVGKNEPVCIVDKVPFEIPDSWEWCRLGDLFHTIMGQSPSGDTVSEHGNGMEFHQGKICFGDRYLKPSSQTTTAPTKVAPANSVLLCVRAPVGKVNITDREICIGRGLCSVVPLGGISVNFAYILLETYEDIFTKQATGTTFIAITGEVVKNQLVPVPPLAEQIRIINKIENISPFVYEYGVKENQLSILNNTFPDSLKKSILQQAVMGKLVSQDPNDEPASVLIEKIRDEKDALVKAGKLKKDKLESIIYRRDNSYYEKLDGAEWCINDEIPFEIPDSWSWCRLRYICHDMRYGTAKKSSKVGKVAVLRMGNIQHGEIDYTNLVYSNDDVDNKALELQMLDILFNRTNSRELVGKTAIYRGDIPAIYAGYLVLIRPILIDPEYLNYVMNSHYEWSFCQRVRSDGINQSNVSASKIGELLIPIPPLSEQKRIVEKLKDALEYCNYLAG